MFFPYQVPETRVGCPPAARQPRPAALQALRSRGRLVAAHWTEPGQAVGKLRGMEELVAETQGSDVLGEEPASLFLVPRERVMRRG